MTLVRKKIFRYDLLSAEQKIAYEQKNSKKIKRLALLLFFDFFVCLLQMQSSKDIRDSIFSYTFVTYDLATHSLIAVSQISESVKQLLKILGLVFPFIGIWFFFDFLPKMLEENEEKRFILWNVSNFVLMVSWYFAFFVHFGSLKSKDALLENEKIYPVRFKFINDFAGLLQKWIGPLAGHFFANLHIGFYFVYSDFLFTFQITALGIHIKHVLEIAELSHEKKYISEYIANRNNVATLFITLISIFNFFSIKEYFYSLTIMYFIAPSAMLFSIFLRKYSSSYALELSKENNNFFEQNNVVLTKEKEEKKVKKDSFLYGAVSIIFEDNFVAILVFYNMIYFLVASASEMFKTFTDSRVLKNLNLRVNKEYPVLFKFLGIEIGNIFSEKKIIRRFSHTFLFGSKENFQWSFSDLNYFFLIPFINNVNTNSEIRTKWKNYMNLLISIHMLLMDLIIILAKKFYSQIIVVKVSSKSNEENKKHYDDKKLLSSAFWIVLVLFSMVVFDSVLFKFTNKLLDVFSIFVNLTVVNGLRLVKYQYLDPWREVSMYFTSDFSRSKTSIDTIAARISKSLSGSLLDTARTFAFNLTGIEYSFIHNFIIFTTLGIFYGATSVTSAALEKKKSEKKIEEEKDKFSKTTDFEEKENNLK